MKDGAYTAPEGKAYLVSVTDAAGRLIWEAEQALGTFGTFHAQLRLDPRAALGNYTLTAREKENPKQAYSSVFAVQKFQLEKIRLKLETDRSVYFRGETVELTIKAEYYWGQPVAEKQISYYLPDDRHLIGHTDAKGEFKVSTTPQAAKPVRTCASPWRLMARMCNPCTTLFSPAKASRPPSRRASR